MYSLLNDLVKPQAPYFRSSFHYENLPSFTELKYIKYIKYIKFQYIKSETL